MRMQTMTSHDMARPFGMQGGLSGADLPILAAVPRAPELP